VVQVAAGGMHSAALTAGGEVFTTGVNDEGALGRRTGAPPRRGCSAAPLGRPTRAAPRRRARFAAGGRRCVSCVAGCLSGAARVSACAVGCCSRARSR